MSAGHITQMQSLGKNSLRPETSIFAQKAHYQREKLGVFIFWIWIPLFLTIFCKWNFLFCLSLEYQCSWISEYFSSGLARMENERWWIDFFSSQKSVKLMQILKSFRETLSWNSASNLLKNTTKCHPENKRIGMFLPH